MIDCGAFFFFFALNTVKFDEDCLTKVAPLAFEQCQSLESVEVPAGVEVYDEAFDENCEVKHE